MNKMLLGILIFLALFILGWYVYLFALSNSQLPSKSDWQNVRQIILKDCKIGKIQLIKNPKDGADHNILFDSFPAVSFDPSTSSYSPPNGFFLTQTFVNKTNTEQSVATDGCPIVWLGDMYGKGTVVYQTEKGQIGKENVTNFPQSGVNPTTSPSIP